MGLGKTTALRIITTLIKPTSNKVRVFNLIVLRQEDEARRIISYLPEEAGAYRSLSGREYLSFMAGFYSEEETRLRVGLRRLPRFQVLERDLDIR